MAKSKSKGRGKNEFTPAELADLCIRVNALLLVLREQFRQPEHAAKVCLIMYASIAAQNYQGKDADMIEYAVDLLTAFQPYIDKLALGPFDPRNLAS